MLTVKPVRRGEQLEDMRSLAPLWILRDSIVPLPAVASGGNQILERLIRHVRIVDLKVEISESVPRASRQKQSIFGALRAASFQHQFFDFIAHLKEQAALPRGWHTLLGEIFGLDANAQVPTEEASPLK